MTAFSVTCRRMQDRHGHRISYLRVSITDRCNERCTYCMPQELQEWLPREEILTFEETLRLIRIAADLGVSKVRVTGGEPLTRRDVLNFIRRIPEIPGIESIGLSTNGTLLAREITSGKTMAAALRDAGVQSVNISLDTLDRDAYSQITGRDFHEHVLRGIDAAISADFDQIKLNTVLMRGRNEDQLIPLVEFAGARDLILRFIEMMPVSTIDVLDENNFISVLEAKRLIESLYGCLIPGDGISDERSGRVLPNSRSETAHWLHRGDDKPAFLRKLQQTSPHMRREIASMSRQLS